MSQIGVRLKGGCSFFFVPTGWYGYVRSHMGKNNGTADLVCENYIYLSNQVNAVSAEHDHLHTLHYDCMQTPV